MSCATVIAAPPRSDTPARAGEPLRRVVQEAMQLARRPVRAERRREERLPYPQLIQLVPVAPDGATPCGEPIVVVGKHLSNRGLDFYHHDPIPFRRVIAWLEGPGEQRHGVLLELLWCRFNRQGWYENGGRFVRLVESPAALAVATQRAAG